MIVEKNCKHYIYQDDRNGEMAISMCNAMTDENQDHEGNDGCYPCPLGLKEKQCYRIISYGSTPMKKGN